MQVKKRFHLYLILLFIVMVVVIISSFSSLAENETNLSAGKSYTKSEEPYGGFSDSYNSESTDGVLAGDYSDGKSYGYQVPEGTTKNIEIVIDLESIECVNTVNIHKWEGAQNYSANNITVFTSQDGQEFQEAGSSTIPVDIWFNLNFENRDARYIKVEFSKYNSGVWGNDWLFIDEIEVYNLNNPGDANYALGKTYEKSYEPEPGYSDNNNESTDGILSYEYADGKSYGYRVATGSSINVDITIDLEEIKTVNFIGAHGYEGVHNYSADMILAYISSDGKNYKLIGSSSSPEGNWFDVNFSDTTARYVKVSFYKFNSGDFGNDWLFIDEISVSKKQAITNSNLASGKIYTKSENPYGSYSDSNNIECVDGILAGDYSDGKSFGYNIPVNESKNIDIILDLEDVENINNVKIHKWEGQLNYGPDKVTVYTSTDGQNYSEKGSLNCATGQWYDFWFENEDVRYVKINYNKFNNGEYGNDWLFLDEIRVYGDVQIPSSSNSVEVTNINDGSSIFVCDGYGDDIQIQSAIDFISSIGGGTVNLNPGIYYPKKEIKLKDNVTLNMDENTKIELPDQIMSQLTSDFVSGETIIKVQNSEGFVPGMQIGLVTNTSGYVDGNYSVIQKVNGNELEIYPEINKNYSDDNSYIVSHYGAIGVFDANNVKIIGGELDGNNSGQSVLIINADSMFNGIASAGNCYNLEIDGIYVHNFMFQGIHPWGNHPGMSISNCQVEYNGAGGIVIDTVKQKFTAYNNNCNYNQQSGFVIANSYDVTVDGGQYIGNDYAGVEITNFYGNENCIVKNINSSDNYIGIKFNYSNNGLINNCTIENNSVYGIFIDNSMYNNINGNTINNSQIGINEENSDYTALTSNVITNCTEDINITGENSTY